MSSGEIQYKMDKITIDELCNTKPKEKILVLRETESEQVYEFFGMYIEYQAFCNVLTADSADVWYEYYRKNHQTALGFHIWREVCK